LQPHGIEPMPSTRLYSPWKRRDRIVANVLERVRLINNKEAMK